MPAVSKAQQRFFGMVRATQKGEMENPSSEVAQAASSMSKSDVKKFAKTKHKGLPEKKKIKEAAMAIPAAAGIAKMAVPAALAVGGAIKSITNRETGLSDGERKRVDALVDKARRLRKNKEAQRTEKDILDYGRKKEGIASRDKVSEETKYDKYDKEKKKFAKADKRMKFGKFYAKAKEVKDGLRPGEVKKWDKEKGRYVSNKD